MSWVVLSFSLSSQNLLNFLLKKGVLFFLLCIFERGRDSLRSMFLGKESAKRLFSIMENFIYSESLGHFARTVREGETVFILQSGSNAHGSFLMIFELLHGCRKGFLVIPEGRMGNGWRGFVWHLKKVLAPGNLAINLPPKLLPRSEFQASKSFAAAVVQGRRSEPKAHRLATEELPQTQDSRDKVNPQHLMLDSRNPNITNLGSQTQDSRESCLGKEKALIGTQLSLVSSDGTKGEVQLDLHFRLVCGPLGTWEISWSKVTEVDSSLIQTSNPKPSDSFKPKHPTVGQHPKPSDSFKPKLPIVGQHSKPKPISNPKPKPISYPKPTQTFGWPNTKPKAFQPLTQSPILNPFINGSPNPTGPL